jgi:hypothetical protein
MKQYRPMFQSYGFHRGPVWIDPRYLERRAPWTWGWVETVTTDHTAPYAPPVDEERIRKIVREEIAGLPIPFDVPDAPPEDGR